MTPETLQYNSNFKVLDESFMMILGHVFEKVYCIEKSTRKETPIFDFYGDPTCGLIGSRNDWFLLGGDILILKTDKDNTVQPISNLTDIFELKLIDDYSALILTDPWSAKSAIYKLTIELNATIRKIEVEKIRAFNEYYNKPYSDSIEW